MMNRLASRKFWLTILSGATVTSLLVAGLVDVETWRWGFGATVVAYLVSQGAQDAASAIKG